MARRGCLAIVLVLGLVPMPPVRAGELKAGAAARLLEATDDMIIGGDMGPVKVKGQEGELRASAVVIEGPDGGRACLIACDVVVLGRDILDDAARRIAEKTGIPFDQILINATHTHHAALHRDGPWLSPRGSVHAPGRRQERRGGGRGPWAAPAGPLRFRLGEESTVGRNSRLLLGDGTIFWVGPHEDAVRPTGPFDPELPVLAFTQPGGELEAVLFNHSTHTIGTIQRGVRSPSFYGLAAQELEKERGGTFLFFEGASGSTHNIDVSTPEALVRIKDAVADALDRAEEHPVARVAGLRREITLRIRHFDEAAEDAAVVAYCTKRQPPPAPSGRSASSVRCARNWPRARASRSRPGCRRSSSATSRWWACPASSSLSWARRSSAGRLIATHTSSSWPTTTWATCPTPVPSIAAATRSGPGSTASPRKAPERAIVGEAVKLLTQLHEGQARTR